MRFRSSKLWLFSTVMVVTVFPLCAQPGSSMRAVIRGGGGNEGKCTIEVNVDEAAEVEISGDLGNFLHEVFDVLFVVGRGFGRESLGEVTDGKGVLVDLGEFVCRHDVFQLLVMRVNFLPDVRKRVGDFNLSVGVVVVAVLVLGGGCGE